MLVFTAFNIVCFALIYNWREKKRISTDRNKVGRVLAIFGMSFTIVNFFLSIIAESIIPQELYYEDHPCFFYKISPNFSDFDVICNTDKFYLKKITDNKSNILSYLCSSVIEVFSLIGALLWINDYRRIKYCISGVDTVQKDEKGILYGALGGYLGDYLTNYTYKGPEGVIYNKKGRIIKKTHAVSNSVSVNHNRVKQSTGSRSENSQKELDNKSGQVRSINYSTNKAIEIRSKEEDTMSKNEGKIVDKHEDSISIKKSPEIDLIEN